MRRSHAQVRQSAYHNPVFTASMLILDDQPLPVDLEDELAASGIILEEFRESVLQRRGPTHANGYQILEAV